MAKSSISAARKMAAGMDAPFLQSNALRRRFPSGGVERSLVVFELTSA
jgi:hypothetical protein